MNSSRPVAGHERRGYRREVRCVLVSVVYIYRKLGI